jgi:hypothetical protein
VHDVEQRLRRDLREFTERVSAESIGPLREPVAGRRRRAVRWLAPVTAMAAVVGVVAAAALASQPSGQPAVRLPADAGPEPAGTMPRYYVTLAATYPQNAPFAFVRDSATGAVLARVPASRTPTRPR